MLWYFKLWTLTQLSVTLSAFLYLFQNKIIFCPSSEMKCQQSKGDVNPSSYSKNYFKLVTELRQENLRGKWKTFYQNYHIGYTYIELNVFYTIYFKVDTDEHVIQGSAFGVSQEDF